MLALKIGSWNPCCSEAPSNIHFGHEPTGRLARDPRADVAAANPIVSFRTGVIAVVYPLFKPTACGGLSPEMASALIGTSLSLPGSQRHRARRSDHRLQMLGLSEIR